MRSPDPPRVAVAICTRNGARFIDEQLQSIRDQTRRPDELIMFDDRSTDETVELAMASLADAPFEVHLACNDHVLGPAENFAAAIASTTADIVALSDQDDVWEPTKLAALERAFADERVVAAFSDAVLVDAAGLPLGGTLWAGVGLRRRALRQVVAGRLLDQLVRWNVVTGATLAFRSSLIPTVLPLPSGAPHDAWIALVAALSGEVRALPQPLVRYRIHGANTVGLPGRDPTAMIAARAHDSAVRGQELHMFQAARQRCPASSAPALELVAAKERFLASRAALGSSAIGRGSHVLAAVASGRYHRLAHGWRSAAHDLLFGA